MRCGLQVCEWCGQGLVAAVVERVCEESAPGRAGQVGEVGKLVQGCGGATVRLGDRAVAVGGHHVGLLVGVVG